MDTVSFLKAHNISKKIDQLFEEEKSRLLKLFPYANVEHVGGTAVPGLVTKGDLDINIRVELEDFPRVVEILKELYQANQNDNWTDNFASFKDDTRNLGIQLTVIGGNEDYFVAQREYLTSHPEVVRNFNLLKESFEGKDMEEYRKEKGRFLSALPIYPHA